MVYICKNCGRSASEQGECCGEDMLMDEFIPDYEDDD